LFAGVAGDFSPLTIEAGKNGPRPAPPALVVAMAVGLGSVDMPVPSVAEWEWLNWRFPRPVHAGDTIYARWTLTQKRPPVGGAATSIVVWRIDVHTADGAMVAEGEMGAKVKRGQAGTHAGGDTATPATSGTSRRRRGRRSRTNGSAPTPEPAPAADAIPPAAKPERAAGTSRRRRRRRSSGSGARDDGRDAGVSNGPAAEPPPPAETPTPAGTTRKGSRRGIGGVLSRLGGSGS